MKYLTILVIALPLLMTVGCEDEVVVDCTALTEDYTTTAETFTSGIFDGSATRSECQATYDSMAELIDKDCMTLAEMQITQAQLDSMKNGTYCDIFFP
jgi:hypothetical protein